jgi:transcriptional regulator with XRE-family HTH domain
MGFSAELRERRYAADLSLREATKRMRDRGATLSFSMLCRYEKGVGLDSMSLHHLRAISKLYRWSLADISKKIAAETAEKEAARAV